MTHRNMLLGRHLAILLLFGLCALTPRFAAAMPRDAGEFLLSFQEEALTQLADQSIDEDQREIRFRQLFNKGFDVPTIGRFVVGRYWRGASQQERDDFLGVFEDIVVQRFLPLLAENTDTRIAVSRITEDQRAPGTVVVASTIPREQGEPYKVGWRIRLKDEQYKILDVIAEGVSMAITLRSEYGSLIKSHGGKVSSLTDALRQKVASGAFAQD